MTEPSELVELTDVPCRCGGAIYMRTGELVSMEEDWVFAWCTVDREHPLPGSVQRTLSIANGT